MSGGLLALLDDVVALTKLTAATLDDAAAQAVKASTKAAGVVIDDAAVTPRYVTGLAAQRELPIVGRIAVGSLKNKLLFLLPAALLLSAFLPQAITPLLMLGGFYLAFEGYEKVHHMVAPPHEDVPGVVGSLGTILGQNGVNIAGLQLGRAERGGRAVSLFHVDSPIPGAVLDVIRAQPRILSATLVRF